MSLRTRLLILFCGLAVAPLGALGLFHYVQTMRGVEALLARQTSTLADRAAREIGERRGVVQSDLLLLAHNVETGRLLEAHARQDTTALRNARSSAEPFFQQLWRQYASWYHGFELRDADGRLVHVIGEQSPVDGTVPGRVHEIVLREAVPEALGTVIAYARSDALLPAEVLQPAFGENGYSMVIDTGTRRLLYHPRPATLLEPMDSAFSAQLVMLAPSGRGKLKIAGNDSVRIASAAAVAGTPWTVVATASLAEFAAPFERVRTIGLLALLLVSVVVFIAFAAATRRATRNLQALTLAADAVGRGNFAPPLPPPGGDEVGRLTRAFGIMTSKVGEMMTQMERSRQMAAIGGFAAEIAHEIRNPLTSVKLNLQRIERMMPRGESEPAAAPMTIALREIERLERVVRGVLDLGAPRTARRELCSVHTVVARALDTIRAHAQQQRVAIAADFQAPTDMIRGDAEQLEGAILNVLLNALDAMPAGGELRVSSAIEDRDGAARLVLRIEDSGPGIPPEQHARLFQPFFTTKRSGSGLGLAIALRAAEEQGGTLLLETGTAAAERGGGACFRFELPLVAAEAYA